MTVADDGGGFPFTGRHDLARLIRYDMGPIVLRERVAALAGALVIESTRQEARLEIGIPLEQSSPVSALLVYRPVDKIHPFGGLPHPGPTSKFCSPRCI
jgi:hypothetical protein